MNETNVCDQIERIVRRRSPPPLAVVAAAAAAAVVVAAAADDDVEPAVALVAPELVVSL